MIIYDLTIPYPRRPIVEPTVIGTANAAKPPIAVA